MSRISPGLLLIAFFGLLASLAGVYVWKKNSQPAPVKAKATPKQPTYIVASGDLPAGRVIHSSDFMTVSISATKLKDAKWPPILMADGRQIVNRRLKLARKQGDPFPPNAFYPEGTEPDLTEQLPPGMRAISLTVPSEGLPAKATPGAIVDVIFRTTPDEEANLPELTSTLVEAVQILAIGNNATVGTTSALNLKAQEHLVTLAVSPTQALKLKATTGHGEFSLTLRNVADDLLDPKPEELTLADIFNLPPREEEPIPFVAEVFRRGQRQTLTFDPDTNNRMAQRNSPRIAPSSSKTRSRKTTGKTSNDPAFQEPSSFEPTNTEPDNTDPNNTDPAEETDAMEPAEDRVEPASNSRRNLSPSRRLQPATLSMNSQPLEPAATIGVTVVQPEMDVELPE